MNNRTIKLTVLIVLLLSATIGVFLYIKSLKKSLANVSLSPPRMYIDYVIPIFRLFAVWTFNFHT
ncbi:hypothetical protein COV04_01050 [Candidatus Uhrbacteria bacterium CG10_big_fil_rev_8_21_14_0_10_48_11]|uniref:Uncharacterized protein n=1 Tax=Candidatus Uhrbacteria bacterium CG10_big_fil_rev_8_21_14_0_10_48_11 TaxID=1975037 RepID=A0A2M8LF79_9BACT|nr:MAG: hypothetical protein COV04_01050 [Candidatus Uhrbacteria bacterium CG10_big_fil_rev_8_21_14_0_10_48_11]